MNGRLPFMRAFWLPLLALSIASAADPMPLLTPIETTGHESTSASVAYRLHPDLFGRDGPGLRDALMTIPVPDRSPIAIRVTEHRWDSAREMALTGKTEPDGEIDLTLAVVDDSVFGTLNLLHDGVFVLEGSTESVIIRPFDPHALKACGGGLIHPGPPERTAHAAASPRALSATGVATVDVAVVYTPNARQGAGGHSQIQSAIANAILQANTVFSNSQIGIAYRLVYKGEVDYTDSGDMLVDLDRLTDEGDGHLEEAHCLRDRYGADLVSLIVEEGQYGGLAWILCYPGVFNPSLGFSIVARSGLAYYTLAHELGHNFGCDHDRQNPSGCRAHSYSYGYRFTNDVYLNKTVMAYDPGFTVGHFSNPDVSFFGTPTGVAPPSPQSAHNASTLTGTVALIASYRPALANPQLLPPPTPAGVSATPIHSNAIRVAWDAACEADGYIVRRHGIAVGATASRAFDDTGLATSSNYCYSVIATNNAGASSASSSACAATPVIPPFVMDGHADHAGYLLSNPGMTIYAAVRTNLLYVATWSTGIYPGDDGRNDHFILVSDQLLPGASAPAPWAKAGQVAIASTKPYLGAESSSDYIGWFNVSGASHCAKHPDNSGQMEGAFNFVQTFGYVPATVYLASAAYSTPDGGALVAQAPAGSGPDIDPHEFLAVPVPTLIDRNSDGTFDRLDPAFDFVTHDVQIPAAGQIRLTWAAVPGKVYRIERAPTPNRTWASVHTVTAGVGQIDLSWTDPTPPGTSSVYRVRHIP